MDKAGKPGLGREQYLIGMVVICAALVLGATAHYGAVGAKGAVGNLSAALDSTEALSSPSMPESTGPQAQDSQSSYVQPNGSVATGSGGEAQVPQAGNAMAQQASLGQQQGGAGAQQAAAAKEVTIDFLYADWCGHCLNMKPRVASVAASLPADRLEVRHWNYAAQDGATREIYALYSRLGHFRGVVPVFVINGNDSQVGEMAEPDFREWVCSKFSSPKPAGC